MPDMRLRIEEKMILHLSSYKDFNNRYNAPKAICQDGISDVLSLHQPQVAKAAKALIAKGLVKQDSGYVRGMPTARKVYYLTAKGIVKANAIKQAIKGYETTSFKPKELLSTLSDSIHTLQQMDSRSGNAKVQLEIVSKLQEVYYELGHWLNVDESYRVLELSRNTGKESDVARAYYYLGRAFTLQNNWDKSIENYREGLEIAEKVDDPNLLGDIHLAIQNDYRKVGDLDNQLEHLQQALNCSNKSGNILLKISTIGANYNSTANYYDDRKMAFSLSNDNYPI